MAQTGGEGEREEDSMTLGGKDSGWCRASVWDRCDAGAVCRPGSGLYERGKASGYSG